MPARATIPPLSLILAFGPALLMPLIALAAWLLPYPYRPLALAAGQLWGAAILLFLAGVRRGLSFFTAGGPRPVQVVTSVWLFVTALAALTTPFGMAMTALALGYLSVALLDPRAAGRGEVPGFFATLRPPQMALFLLGIGGLTLVWMQR